jgi:tetratricopeptide (TPR) repeat protein
MADGMRITALFLIVIFAATAGAQTILLKDGKRVAAKSLRRQGDNIMAQSPSVAGGQAVQGEVGYPLSQIEKIEFAEPAILKGAGELIATGRAADALTQIEPALNYFAAFRDAPGSYWGDLAALKLTALVTVGREAEAEPLARQVIEKAGSTETVQAAQAQLAGIAGRKGDHESAIKLCDDILKEGSKAETLAVAAINKARSHQALKQWEKALLAYLQIPVFYPEQKSAAPASLLGAAQCYFELSDLPRARGSLDELTKTFADSPEAEVAKAELEKVDRREKALEAVK